MSGSGNLPAAPPNTPGFPENPTEYVFDGFDTLNTKPSRPAIDDNQMYICNGYMPFGKNNLRTLYGIGGAAYTNPNGIANFAFINIGATPYVIVISGDGAITAINTNTFGGIGIAGPGTIQNPSQTSTGISQWGNKYAVIVANQTNGYFLWDGGLLYQAGGLGPDVDIISPGINYAFSPTLTASGGEGGGASFTATVRDGTIETITVDNPGAGYNFYDVVQIIFSGGNNTTFLQTAQVEAFINAGSVSGFQINSTGAGYTSTAQASILGGGGTGATATVVVTNGAVTAVNLVGGGSGYVSPPTVIITDPNSALAVATVAIMPFGVQGSTVETYQNRVWVGNGPKILFTAAEASADFGTPDGGGAFQSFDSFLRNTFTSLKQSNGFLYLLADSSMNYISGVTTSGNPATTTFSNQNVDPQIGTSWPNTVQVFSRNIVFANSFGVHVSYGGAITKVSDQLDGIYTTVPGFGGFTPSAAVAVIFGVHVYMLLLPVIDQVTGQQVNKLLMWDGKRWWTADQEIQLTMLATQELNSVMTAWGTDGRSLYALFQQPSTSLTKTVQSKLFLAPAYYFKKLASRVFTLVDYNAASTSPITVSLDDGIDTTTNAVIQPPPGVVWTNNTGAVISWTNNAGQTLGWGRQSGLLVNAFAVSQPGPMLGITMSTQAGDLTIISSTLIAQIYQTLL